MTKPPFIYSIKHGIFDNPVLLFFSSAVILIIVDQVIKKILFQYLSANLLLNNQFGLVLFKNYEFAFSIPFSPIITYSIYSAAFLVIGWWLYKSFHKLTTLQLWAWSLIIAGGSSNVAERMITGYVKDYLLFLGGIFNLADILIIAGALILLIKDFIYS